MTSQLTLPISPSRQVVLILSLRCCLTPLHEFNFVFGCMLWFLLLSFALYWPSPLCFWSFLKLTDQFSQHPCEVSSVIPTLWTRTCKCREVRKSACITQTQPVGTRARSWNTGSLVPMSVFYCSSTLASF